MSRKTQADARLGATPITEGNAFALAELILKKIDLVEHRGGRAIEYRESSGGGMVKIHRDQKGRVYFRAPRVGVVSKRLEVNTSKCLSTADNIRRLEGFLLQNPLVLSFLDSQRIR